MIKVGYQGDEGSNTELASHKFFEKSSEEIEYIPMVTAERVVDGLIKKEIDYGVMPVRNLTFGIIEETGMAINGKPIKSMQQLIMPIHHSLFIRPEADISEIKTVYTHKQALRQTETWRENHHPDFEYIEIKDQSEVAKRIANDPNCISEALICNDPVGERFGLKLVYQDIEDDDNNETIFSLYYVE